jgi:hypothetical protein
MSQVILDDALRERLNESESYVELRGTDGTLIGYFLKPATHLQLLRAWVNSDVTEAELDQARQEYREHGGRTLPEVFSELRRRGIPGVPGE